MHNIHPDPRQWRLYVDKRDASLKINMLYVIWKLCISKTFVRRQHEHQEPVDEKKLFASNSLTSMFLQIKSVITIATI